MNTNNTMMVYFCQYNLGNIALQPIVNGIMIGTSVVAILAIPTLVKHFGKKRTCVACFIVGAVANGLNFILPTNTVTFIIFVTIGYVALAIPNGITRNLVSDVIDYGEWHTGIRKGGYDLRRVQLFLVSLRNPLPRSFPAASLPLPDMWQISPRRLPRCLASRAL